MPRQAGEFPTLWLAAAWAAHPVLLPCGGTADSSVFAGDRAATFRDLAERSASVSSARVVPIDYSCRLQPCGVEFSVLDRGPFRQEGAAPSDRWLDLFHRHGAAAVDRDHRGSGSLLVRI